MSLRRLVSVLLLSAAALYVPSSVRAQGLIPGVETQRQPDLGAEVFSGYSGYRSGGIIDNVKLPDFKFGWAGQIILNINRRAGFVVNLGDHSNSSASAFDFSVGPRLQLPLGRFKPFAEASTGVQHFTPKNFPSQNTPTYTGGVGMDVKVNSSFSIRPFQLSFITTSYSALSPSTRPNYFNGFVAQTGMLYHINFRRSQEAEIFALCTAEPTPVDPGVKVNIGVTPKGFRHKQRLRYSYATPGGVIAGSSAVESIDTTGFESGGYTVTATVTDQGKNPLTASCKAQFTVNANAKQTPPPPVNAKQTPPPPVEAKQTPPVAPVENASKPEPKPEDAATIADAAHRPGTDNGPMPSVFGIIQFDRDARRPARVDNEAKGELDRYAYALAATPDATGVLVGYSGARASRQRIRMARRRAVNTKQYLAQDEGIDPQRIQPRTASGPSKKTELWIVPAAATFAAEGTKVVNEKAFAPPTLKAGDAHKKAHKAVGTKREHKPS